MDSKIVALVTESLVDIMSGDWHMTEEIINQEKDENIRNVLDGLLYVYQDLEFQKAKHKQITDELQNSLVKLKRSNITLEYAEERINDSLNVLSSIASLNFSIKARVTDDGDNFDALALAANMLGEELESSIVEKSVLEKNQALLDIQNKKLNITQFSVDSAAVEIFWINPAGQIIYANDFFCHSLGYTKKEILLKTILDINPRVTVDEWADHWQEISTVKTLNVETVHKKNNGETYPVDVSLSYHKIGETEYVNVVGNNTVERKKQEATILAQNKFLKVSEEKLLQSNRTLEVSNKKLSDLNDSLDSFVYRVSHDLKSPVVNQLSMIKMLKSHSNTKDEFTQKIIDNLEKSCYKFESTIQDFLQLAKIEKEIEHTYERIDITNLIDEILKSLDSIINSSKANISVDCSKCNFVTYPRTNFNSILLNLITNSIKYSHPDRDSIIEITTDYIDNQFILEIKDNGIGIDLKKDKDKLFEMFIRLSYQAEGTGVGLYVIKKLLEQSGDSIEVESEIGKGSTFKVYINEKKHEKIK